MRVVIAPDSFKGSASATEATTAIASGWAGMRPLDALDLVPMADGGEGSLEAFAAASPSAVRHRVVVSGPLDEQVESVWLELPDRVGVVELASSSGITLLERLEPARAHTRGFGQTIQAALDAGMAEIVACIGGSASNDGGAGMLLALGARLLDGQGDPIGPGAAALDDLVKADLAGLAAIPPGGVRVVTDVDAPLIGSTGAVHGYGPQKGVRAHEFDRYEQRLLRLAGLLGVDPAASGSGAAGGTGAGLLAWGAVLEPGAQEVAARLGLADRIAGADLVITGEGRFDEQSATGKAPEHARRLAADRAVPVALIAGSVVGPAPGFTAVRALADLAGSEAAAMQDPLRWLHEAGRSLALEVPEWDRAGRP